MREQEFKFENPFKTAQIDDFDLEQLLFDNISGEREVSYNDLLSNIISINKNYKKLSETYQDVKKMANTYIDNTEKQSVSNLESKLSRYYT